jgi:TonB family protein
MNTAATILRIADRFVSHDSVNSIEKTGDLRRIIVIVSVSYCIGILSLLPIAKQLERNRQAVVSNLTIEFTLPEPIKPPEVILKLESPKAQAAPSGIGAQKVDRSLPSPPQKVTTAKPKPQDLAKNKANAQPVDSSLKRAVPRPVIIVKANDGTQPAKPVENVPAPQAQKTVAVSTAPLTDNRSAFAETPRPTAAGQSGTGDRAAQVGQGDRVGGGGADDGKGAQGQQIALLPPQNGAVAKAMGNIAPYRRDMLLRLAANWHPKKHTQGNIVVVITLSKDGRLLNTELVTGSGNDKLDEYAVAAVGKTEFAPLPDWFRGSQLRLRVELAKVEALKNDI